MRDLLAGGGGGAKGQWEVIWVEGIKEAAHFSEYIFLYSFSFWKHIIVLHTQKLKLKLQMWENKTLN